METITLDYNDYMILIEGYTKSKSIDLDLEYMLNCCDYDRYDEDVNARQDDLRVLFKKYIKDKYDKKIAELKIKYEQENK